MIRMLLLYTLAAANLTLTKTVLSYGQPHFFIAVKMLMAGAMILSYFALRNKKFPTIKKDNLGKKTLALA